MIAGNERGDHRDPGATESTGGDVSDRILMTEHDSRSGRSRKDFHRKIGRPGILD
jgi:hypothetical protein